MALIFAILCSKSFQRKISDPLKISGKVSWPLNFPENFSDPLKNPPTGYPVLKMTNPYALTLRLLKEIVSLSSVSPLFLGARGTFLFSIFYFLYSKISFYQRSIRILLDKTLHVKIGFRIRTYI